jgi:hypothetical protein
MGPYRYANEKRKWNLVNYWSDGMNYMEKFHGAFNFSNFDEN